MRFLKPFFKKIRLVLDKILNKNIQNFLFLVFLLILDILLNFRNDF